MRKFAVAPSVTRSRSYAAYRRFARNPNAFPVASTVRLKFNYGWFPDKQFMNLYRMSGQVQLQQMAGWTV